MNSHKTAKIPPAFCSWILFLAQTIPIRSTLTFIELLVGASLTQSGFVTEAYSVINMRNSWPSYYKWLQKLG